MIYLNKVMPKESRQQNALEIINEFLNIVVITHFYLFTDFVQDLDVKYNLGWSLLFVISSMLFLNFFCVIKDFIHKMVNFKKGKDQKKRYKI